MIDSAAFLKQLVAEPAGNWSPDYKLAPVSQFSWQAKHVHFTFWVSDKTQRLYIFWSGIFLGNPSGPLPPMLLRGRIMQRPYSVRFTEPPAHLTASTLGVRELQVLGDFHPVLPHVRAIRQHLIEAKGKYMKDYPKEAAHG